MNSFTINIPGIIIGFICLFFFVFLIFAIISKVTGTSIGYRGGITNKGETIASPDTLDALVSEGRKLVDKKYKIKKTIQEEFKTELKAAISPIEQQVLILERMYGYTLKVFRKNDAEAKLKVEKIKLELKNDFPNISVEELKYKLKSRYGIMTMLPDEMEEIDRKLEELQLLKQKKTKEIQMKYAHKMA